jgi:phospholipase C
VAPWAPRGVVQHAQFDHTSVLSMIEWRWNLAPLSVRDRSAQNLARALDFDAPSTSAPQFAVPPGPFGAACTGTITGVAAPNDFAALRTVAAQLGWPIYG